MMVQASNLSTQEAEAGGLQVWGWPELHSETLSNVSDDFHEEKKTTNAGKDTEILGGNVN
jgi:hypothetical protein